MRCARSAALALVALSACRASEPEVPFVVYAAASLRDAFTTLGAGFERAHPGPAPSFDFAGSQELRTRIEHGAAADVYAAADRVPMEALLREGRVAAPVSFARNEPVVVLSASSTLASFAELPNAERIVVGAPEVPIGRYTLELLDRASAALGPGFRARVEAKVVSRELNVRQVLAKVQLGEAEAGVVYRTDVTGAGLRVLEIPREVNVAATYPIARLTGAALPERAQAWIDFVRSEAGQHILSLAGFLPPDPPDPPEPPDPSDPPEPSEPRTR